MRFAFSIVIICKNAAATIERTMESVCGLSNDVVVYDSGSTDATLEILKKYKAKIFQGEWLGFGATRQKATELASESWVLMVDADEIITDGLRQELAALLPPSPKTAYQFVLKHSISSHHLQWGSWRNDYRIRLYNKDVLQWNDRNIHETLGVPKGVRIKKFTHGVIHHPAVSLPAFEDKMSRYASLVAEQYKQEGKKATWVKRRINPAYTFFQNYILKLGFLDGRAGFQLARTMSRYTFEKYDRLSGLS
jgi:glycosyltransferase involved in cell wall biosynthesis